MEALLRKKKGPHNIKAPEATLKLASEKILVLFYKVPSLRHPGVVVPLDQVRILFEGSGVGFSGASWIAL
jgi:hypothetical protein